MRATSPALKRQQQIIDADNSTLVAVLQHRLNTVDETVLSVTIKYQNSGHPVLWSHYMHWFRTHHCRNSMTCMSLNVMVLETNHSALFEFIYVPIWHPASLYFSLIIKGAYYMHYITFSIFQYHVTFLYFILNVIYAYNVLCTLNN